MNFYKFASKRFTLKQGSLNSFIKSEFNLTRKEIRELNNEIKKPWVRPGWDRVVGLWFLASAGITLGMIVIGGYVRLNKAGLSMVRWDLTRISPPKNQSEWEKEFKEYQEHPQYKNDFPDLTLEGYKWIYLLEHYHRQLGKVLGLFVIIPSILFSVTKIFNKRLMYRSLFLSLLIITQGTIGMWMVRSGLNENLGENYGKNKVSVSHYRLATHFTFGVATYWLLMNSAIFMLLKPNILKHNFLFYNSNAIVRKNLIYSIHFVLFTAIFGSLMAGQDGGKICNTFPKLGTVWYPGKEYYNPEISFLRNNLETPTLVHFNHRLIATITLSTILLQTVRIMGLGHISKGALRGASFVAFVGLMQYYLGMISVWNSVPINLAHLHQFCGTLLITSCIVAISISRKVKPAEMKILLTKLFEKDSVKLHDYMNHFSKIHPEIYSKYIKDEYTLLNQSSLNILGK